MKGKSFFGLIKPQITYPPTSGAASSLKCLDAPVRATFLISGTMAGQEKAALCVGDAVKAGQKLTLAADLPGYAISSISGTVSDISPFTGANGADFTAVTVDASGEQAEDDSWQAVSQEPSLETAAQYLDALPGLPGLSRFLAPDHGIHTLVINGADVDLKVGTQLQTLTARSESLKSGISVLKQITGIDQVILAAPEDRFQGYGHLGAAVKAVSLDYPSALPSLIMKDVIGTVVPVGKRPEDLGVAFLTAEAVAAIGDAYDTQKIPSRKYITVIGKNGGMSMVEAAIGTPMLSILNALGETLKEKDRLILGGPMMGVAIYSDLHPVGPDTDAIMIQDHAGIAAFSDYPCINCGECVRICPVNVPINLLVRFLEAGAYEDAASLYDLYSCIECGLCSYVCVSRIPIFQYIRLAKHELARTQAAEATND